MAAPWRGARAGALRAIWSGEVTIGAGSGDPWRVRYDLRFSIPTLLTFALCVAILRYGIHWHWPRTRLIDLLLITWIAVYGVPVACSRCGCSGASSAGPRAARASV